MDSAKIKTVIDTKRCVADAPIPFSPVLEKAWIPDEERLIAVISEMM